MSFMDGPPMKEERIKGTAAREKQSIAKVGPSIIIRPSVRPSVGLIVPIRVRRRVQRANG